MLLVSLDLTKMKLKIIRIKEEEESKLKDSGNIFHKIIAEIFS